MRKLRLQKGRRANEIRRYKRQTGVEQAQYENDHRPSTWNRGFKPQWKKREGRWAHSRWGRFWLMHQKWFHTLTLAEIKKNVRCPFIRFMEV